MEAGKKVWQLQSPFTISCIAGRWLWFFRKNLKSSLIREMHDYQRLGHNLYEPDYFKDEVNSCAQRQPLVPRKEFAICSVQIFPLVHKRDTCSIQLLWSNTMCSIYHWLAMFGAFAWNLSQLFAFFVDCGPKPGKVFVLHFSTCLDHMSFVFCCLSLPNQSQLILHQVP